LGNSVPRLGLAVNNHTNIDQAKIAMSPTVFKPSIAKPPQSPTHVTKGEESLRARFAVPVDIASSSTRPD
jgi:hypothetical protein